MAQLNPSSDRPLRVYGSAISYFTGKLEGYLRLQTSGCWEPLWRVRECHSGHDADRRAPFARGLTVF